MLLLNQLLELLLIQLVDELLVEDRHLLLLEAHVFLLEAVEVTDGIQLLLLHGLEGKHLLGRSRLFAAVTFLRAVLARLRVSV